MSRPPIADDEHSSALLAINDTADDCAWADAVMTALAADDRATLTLVAALLAAQTDIRPCGPDSEPASAQQSRAADDYNHHPHHPSFRNNPSAAASA